MVIVWTTGLYPANTFESFYGLPSGENWIAKFTAPAGGTLRTLMLLGVGQ